LPIARESTESTDATVEALCTSSGYFADSDLDAAIETFSLTDKKVLVKARITLQPQPVWKNLCRPFSYKHFVLRLVVRNGNLYLTEVSCAKTRSVLLPHVLAEIRSWIRPTDPWVEEVDCASHAIHVKSGAPFRRHRLYVVPDIVVVEAESLKPLLHVFISSSSGRKLAPLGLVDCFEHDTVCAVLAVNAHRTSQTDHCIVIQELTRGKGRNDVNVILNDVGDVKQPCSHVIEDSLRDWLSVRASRVCLTQASTAPVFASLMKRGNDFGLGENGTPVTVDLASMRAKLHEAVDESANVFYANSETLRGCSTSVASIYPTLSRDVWCRITNEPILQSDVSLDMDLFLKYLESQFQKGPHGEFVRRDGVVLDHGDYTWPDLLEEWQRFERIPFFCVRPIVCAYDELSVLVKLKSNGYTLSLLDVSALTDDIHKNFVEYIKSEMGQWLTRIGNHNVINRHWDVFSYSRDCARLIGRTPDLCLRSLADTTLAPVVTLDVSVHDMLHPKDLPTSIPDFTLGDSLEGERIAIVIHVVCMTPKKDMARKFMVSVAVFANYTDSYSTIGLWDCGNQPMSAYMKTLWTHVYGIQDCDWKRHGFTSNSRISPSVLWVPPEVFSGLDFSVDTDEQMFCLDVIRMTKAVIGPLESKKRRPHGNHHIDKGNSSETPSDTEPSSCKTGLEPHSTTGVIPAISLTKNVEIQPLNTDALAQSDTSKDTATENHCKHAASVTNSELPSRSPPPAMSVDSGSPIYDAPMSDKSPSPAPMAGFPTHGASSSFQPIIESDGSETKDSETYFAVWEDIERESSCCDGDHDACTELRDPASSRETHPTTDAAPSLAENLEIQTLNRGALAQSDNSKNTAPAGSPKRPKASRSALPLPESADTLQPNADNSCHIAGQDDPQSSFQFFQRYNHLIQCPSDDVTEAEMLELLYSSIKMGDLLSFKKMMQTWKDCHPLRRSLSNSKDRMSQGHPSCTFNNLLDAMVSTPARPHFIRNVLENNWEAFDSVSWSSPLLFALTDENHGNHSAATDIAKAYPQWLNSENSEPSPIHLAAKQGNLDLLKCFWDLSLQSMGCSGDLSKTPFMQPTAHFNDSNILESLIVLAMRHGHVNILTHFLSYYTDPLEPQMKENVKKLLTGSHIPANGRRASPIHTFLESACYSYELFLSYLDVDHAYLLQDTRHAPQEGIRLTPERQAQVSRLETSLARIRSSEVSCRHPTRLCHTAVLHNRTQALQYICNTTSTGNKEDTTRQVAETYSWALDATPLSLAVVQGNLDLLKFFINYGGRGQVSTDNNINVLSNVVAYNPSGDDMHEDHILKETSPTFGKIKSMWDLLFPRQRNGQDGISDRICDTIVLPLNRNRPSVLVLALKRGLSFAVNDILKHISCHKILNSWDYDAFGTKIPLIHSLVLYCPTFQLFTELTAIMRVKGCIDFDYTEMSCNMSLMHLAVSSTRPHSTSVIDWILLNRPFMLLQKRNGDRWTPLDYACHLQNYRVVYHIIRHIKEKYIDSPANMGGTSITAEDIGLLSMHFLFTKFSSELVPDESFVIFLSWLLSEFKEYHSLESRGRDHTYLLTAFALAHMDPQFRQILAPIMVRNAPRIALLTTMHKILWSDDLTDDKDSINSLFVAIHEEYFQRNALPLKGPKELELEKDVMRCLLYHPINTGTSDPETEQYDHCEMTELDFSEDTSRASKRKAPIDELSSEDASNDSAPPDAKKIKDCDKVTMVTVHKKVAASKESITRQFFVDQKDVPKLLEDQVTDELTQDMSVDAQEHNKTTKGVFCFDATDTSSNVKAALEFISKLEATQVPRSFYLHPKKLSFLTLNY